MLLRGAAQRQVAPARTPVSSASLSQMRGAPPATVAAGAKRAQARTVAQPVSTQRARTPLAPMQRQQAPRQLQRTEGEKQLNTLREEAARMTQDQVQAINTITHLENRCDENKQKCEKLGALIALLSWDANTDVVGVLLVMPDTTPGSCMFLAITRAGAVRVD